MYCPQYVEGILYILRVVFWLLFILVCQYVNKIKLF
jgi:hypothetical protein